MSDLKAYLVDVLKASTAAPPCKICGSETATFDIVDFNKAGTAGAAAYPYGVSGIPIVYYKCGVCKFIFTDFLDELTDEQWTTYVYNDDYYIGVDPEYAEIRPRDNTTLFASMLAGQKDNIVGLDYGGGNGKTAELMRAAGWSYDCWDPFGHADLTPGLMGKYNFCSSMEVFEHVPDPVASLQSLVEKCTSDELIITVGTCVHDGIATDAMRLNWWYAAPRNGHISLHSRKSLTMLAAKFGLSYVSISKGTHLLVRGHTKREMQALLLRGKLRAKVNSVLR